MFTSFDADANQSEVSYERGNKTKYFPKPEGTPRDSSKIPATCKKKVTKQTSLVVKSTGGRMSLTQVRSNFQGRMLNDTDDPNWLPSKLAKLVEGLARRHQVLHAVAGPFDCSPEDLRQNADHDFLRIKRPFAAEPTADIGRNHANSVTRQVQDVGQRIAHQSRYLGRGVKR